MQARVDWVLIVFGTQAIKKPRPVRPVFPDYLSVSYDYVITNKISSESLNRYELNGKKHAIHGSNNF